MQRFIVVCMTAASFVSIAEGQATNQAVNESQIHRQVDAFIVRNFTVPLSNPDRTRLVAGVRQLGATREAPAVFVLDKPDHRSLIVAYSLSKRFMGPGGTAVTVRAYSQRSRRLQLIDVTGNDMNGYDRLTAIELRSPAANRLLLLLSGYMTGANGPNNRMRIYSFDGSKFRTIWMPENVWGTFTVRATDAGFVVEGEYYRESRTRRDQYSIADDGVSLMPPSTSIVR